MVRPKADGSRWYRDSSGSRDKLRDGTCQQFPGSNAASNFARTSRARISTLELAHLDERMGNVVLLAGEEVFIEIYPNGNWRFINET